MCSHDCRALRPLAQQVDISPDPKRFLKYRTRLQEKQRQALAFVQEFRIPYRRFWAWDITEICIFTPPHLAVMSIRILLIDDHRVIRKGLRALLNDYPDFE